MNRAFRSPLPVICLILMLSVNSTTWAQVSDTAPKEVPAAVTETVDAESKPASDLPANATIQETISKTEAAAPASAGISLAEQDPHSDKTPQKWVVQNLFAGQENIELISGMGTVMHFDRPISRVSTSDPTTADVAIISTNEFLITTKKVGASTVLVWDYSGKVYVFNLNTIPDPTSIKQTIQSLSPDGKVVAHTTKDGYVVTGTVNRAEVRDQINNAAKGFNKESISVVTVENAKQILLETRFIEIDRGTAMEFGIDWNVATKHMSTFFLPGSTAATVMASEGALAMGIPSEGMNTLGAFDYTDDNLHIGSVLKAMEDKNVLKIIARPNILVRDGDEAEFLVGGQMPIPTVTANTQEVTFKDFGTKLKYKPFVLENNEVRLELATEVSALDFANGITSAGMQIPAFSTRKATTVVELKPGQTLVIGGLLQQRKTEIESGTPYLRKIPWLGRLFESTDNEYKEVELMVIITPYIIDPDQNYYDLSKTTIDQPIHTAIEMDNPPFEDKRGLAMEQVLHKYESERAEQYVAEDRKIKRDKLWQKYKTKKQKKRAKDKDYYEMVNKTLYDGKAVYQPDELTASSPNYLNGVPQNGAAR